VYTPADGSAATVMDVYDFKGPGVAMAMYNTDEVSIVHSILGFCWSNWPLTELIP